MSSIRPTSLRVGDSIPWVSRIIAGYEEYFSLDTAAGRFVAFLFLPSLFGGVGGELLDRPELLASVVDNINMILFIVTQESVNASAERVRQRVPGLRFLYDVRGDVMSAFLLPASEYTGYFFIADPSLRITWINRLDCMGTDPISTIAGMLGQAPRMSDYAPNNPVPVLSLNNILEPSLCSALVTHFQANRIENSPVIRGLNSGASHVATDTIKVRKDGSIGDVVLRDAVVERISTRVFPAVRNAFQVNLQTVERLIIGCYSATDGGYFSMHRDNTLPATAHRRFACSINLNSEFEGGFIGFPEYSSKLFRVGTGACVVFSCSIMHMVSKVTQGSRYAVLPFLF